MLQSARKCSTRLSLKQLQRMSTAPRFAVGTGHVERTAGEPRDDSLHKVVLGNVQQVNERIRVLRLDIPENHPPIRFLPGQWLDVFVPGIAKPGGFTITSIPSDALPSSDRLPAVGPTSGYLELAVQDSPRNPPAAWLWRPEPEILGHFLRVRVGGSFVWPPPGVNLREVKRILLIAGGVGINPLISIVGHLAQASHLPYEISFIYSLRDPGAPHELSSFLFLERLVRILAAPNITGKLSVHLTPCGNTGESKREAAIQTPTGVLQCRKTRVGKEDVLEALGPIENRFDTVCYICGVPAMTDELVHVVQNAEGIDPKKVLFERWW